MNKLFALALLLTSFLPFSQVLEMKTISNAPVIIRAIQIWDGKVWYSGTDSKFGYVNLTDSADRKEKTLYGKPLQFRTLAQSKKYFYAINIESPARFFQINKKDLTKKIVFTDTLSTAFYDALHFYNDNSGIAFSDPAFNQKLNTALTQNGGETWSHCYDCDALPSLENGEAAFAASNSNISSFKDKFIWIATGGKKSRIFRSKNYGCQWEVFETPIIQGTSTQGIYSIDFYDKKFGIVVGGDYTKQSENINNIATTNDGGKTWQIQASGKNAGYTTCVKIRPQSGGKDIIAVGDQHVSYSSDYGKTWKKLSSEKGLYVCEWVDRNTIVFAGKNKIIKAKLPF